MRFDRYRAQCGEGLRITRDGMRVLMHADPSSPHTSSISISDRLSDMAAEMRRIDTMVADQIVSIPQSKSTAGQMAQVNLH